MITLEQALAAEAVLAAIETPGLRKVCSYCGAPLAGSDPMGERISHGICKPLCGPAKAMGWTEPEEAA